MMTDKTLMHLIIGMIIFIIYAFLIKSLAGDNNHGIPKNLLVVILIFLTGFLAFKLYEFIFNTAIETDVVNAKTNNPIINVDLLSGDNKPPPSNNIGGDGKPQVFNIPANIYSYNEAKEVCKAFDAKLASYEDVEEYYKKGGEFCNYGWSEGQMVLFPTQKKTFDKLQNIAGHEWDCGRQGVNGGYIANPQVKFGVNCKGVKPPINDAEKTLMQTSTYYPENNSDIYWKKQINNILLSPFNQQSWSQV